MSTGDPQYIHGTHPEEQERLALLNDLLNNASLKALGLRVGEKVLDIGSGLGQLSRAIGRVLGPGGRVVAIERDPEQLADALRRAERNGESDLVDFRQGEATRPPLADDEWGSFDVAHTRFLLEHVPDPQAVVETMVRALKPGGRIVLEDDDHDVLRLWPEAPRLDRLWRAYFETYWKMGNDPLVGRRLVQLIYDAGATPVRNDRLFFGSCAGSPEFEHYITNFIGVLESARKQIVELTDLDAEAIDEGIKELEKWSRRPDAALWYGTGWAEGRKPGESATRARKKAVAQPDSSPTKISSMQFLAESARDLTSTLKLEEVFRKIAGRVTHVVDHHLFCVLLWNEDTQLLEHTYSLRYGEHHPIAGGFPIGYGISGAAAELGRPIRVPNVLLDPRYVRYRHPEVEIHSELAIPLIIKERLVGVLDIESVEFDTFTEEHEQMLSALASQMATAIDNARLYENVRRNERRLEEDLATARRIQAGLLPPKAPRVKGLDVGTAYAPAMELAGDFYDLFRYGDGCLAVAAGDVSGKATPAALFGSLTVGIMRGHVLEKYWSPAALLENINEQLLIPAVEDRFVAMVFAIFDGRDRSLVISNAGFPLPYMVRGGRIDTIEVQGQPLGIFPDQNYNDRRIKLERGDVVAFCSDGLVDCENDKGEHFGIPRFEEVLLGAAEKPAQAIADALLEATNTFAAGNTHITDDRTVVVVKLA